MTGVKVEKDILRFAFNVGDAPFQLELDQILEWPSEIAYCFARIVRLCDDPFCTTLHKSEVSLSSNPTLEDELGFVKPILSIDTSFVSDKTLYLQAANSDASVFTYFAIVVSVSGCKLQPYGIEALIKTFEISADFEVDLRGFFYVENTCIE